MMLTSSSVVALSLLAGFGGLALASSVVRPARAQAPVQQTAAAQERTVWYLYRVKWGFQDEFVELFKKNHYPLLKAQVGGRIVAVKMYVPTYHGDGRADWTFAVSITYKDTAAMTGPSGEAELARKLFPDQERFRREEQRRFELLDAHWDVPLNELTFDAK